MKILGQKPYTFDRTVRLVLVCLLVVGMVAVLRHLSEVLLPFALAMALAYLFNPVVSALERRVNSRGVAVFMTLVLILLSVGGLGWLAIPQMVGEVAHLARLLKELGENSPLAQEASQRLPEDVWLWLKQQVLGEDVRQWVQSEQGMGALKSVTETLAPSFLKVWKGATAVLALLAAGTIVALTFFFVLLDYPKTVSGIQGLIPPSLRPTLVNLADEFDVALSRYFRAQAVVASMVGVLFGIGFWLIGLPLPWLLGLLLGLLNLVPYLQILGLFPAFFLALVTALDQGTGFVALGGLTALVFLVVQLIQDALIVPKVMGKASGLSPAVILLALSVWGKLLGILGLVIAIPATCLMEAWYRRWVLDRQEASTELEEASSSIEGQHESISGSAQENP